MRLLGLLVAAHVLSASAADTPGNDGTAVSSPSSGRQPTAVRKMGFDPSEKFYPEYAAFVDPLLPAEQAPLDQNFLALSPGEAADAARQWLDAEEQRLLALSHNTTESAARLFRLPFALHSDEESWPGVFRRGLGLGKRQACPTGMNNCAKVGAPNKCCVSGTYCAAINDEDSGNVACCPNGASCEGTVGTCPEGAESCAADLGGGCCIPGYVCFGVGCIPRESVSTALPVVTTITSVITDTGNEVPSTVVIVITTTILNPVPPVTRTSIRTVTGAGDVPYRPTITSGADTATESYCPAGYYGCLAVHGGGCCRTDRDCATHDCPPTERTTVVGGPVTVAVPVSDVPEATATCLGGWFLCGEEGGAIPGCCPVGFTCGTASCTEANPTAMQTVQKERPTIDAGVAVGANLGLVYACVAWLALHLF